ncbi:uncharacterized protein [Periplaneta americana]|uniref:uncharacterized protein isoform X4 n=1 Tax=Periplaneta americana TaxID=6978 RepID=UPI0037E8BD66
MDAIKTEPKMDPLAEQSCDDSVMEEANCSPDKDTAMESHDSSCDFKCDVKIEETKDPITFPMMKCELEQKNYRRTTGGGCPDPETDDVTLNDLDRDIVAFLLHEFTKDDAEFDSDARASYKDICTPISSTPVSSTICAVNPVSRTRDVCAVNPVSRTLDECGLNVTVVVDNRQSNGSQEDSMGIRDRSTSGCHREDSAPKPLRLTEYETELLLLQKQKHEAEMKRAEEIHRAQMEWDDEIHELKKAKLLLEIEMLRKHN